MRNYAASKSILWSALKLYARVRDADKDFKEFKDELTPGHVEAMRDYRLKWILQLVVRYYKWIPSHEVLMLNSRCPRPFDIPNFFFTDTSSKYVC